MQIIALNTFGGPEVLSVLTALTPDPAPDQIRVRVSHATVNPTDALLRSGAQEKSLESKTPPWIPGMEFAGVVDAIGSGSTDAGFTLGDPVIGLVNPRRGEGGAYAEYVNLSPASLALRPETVPSVKAAVLPMNGMTAIMAMEELGLSEGSTVLVTGGAGALGGYVIQLARHAGLTVIGHGRTHDADALRDLGADHVVTGAVDLAGEVRELFPSGVDGLVDAANLGQAAGLAVKQDGVAVHVRPAPADADPRLTHRVVSVTKRIDDTASLRQLMAWAADGVLTPRVARVLGIDGGPEAHQLVESGGLRGRVVLDLGD